MKPMYDYFYNITLEKTMKKLFTFSIIVIAAGIAIIVMVKNYLSSFAFL